MTAEKVLEIARGEIGEKESPAGSNKNKYGAAYGWNGVAWCVQFVWWCFRTAGAKALFYGGNDTASCSVLWNYHKAQAVTGGYKPGDIVFMNFKGGTSTDHIGICESWNGSTMTTIEGNTSLTSQDNGGAVMRRTRNKGVIVAAYRPAYEEEEQDNTPSKWAEDDVKWARKVGLLKGDDKGDLKLHDPVTREQMCVFLHRFMDLK